MTWSNYLTFWCVQTLTEGLFLQMAPQNIKTHKLGVKANPLIQPLVWGQPRCSAGIGVQLMLQCSSIDMPEKAKKPSRWVPPTFVIISMLLLRCLPNRFCLDQIFIDVWKLQTAGDSRGRLVKKFVLAGTQTCILPNLLIRWYPTEIYKTQMFLKRKLDPNLSTEF